jgi:hypothetical protein
MLRQSKNIGIGIEAFSEPKNHFDKYISILHWFEQSLIKVHFIGKRHESCSPCLSSSRSHNSDGLYSAREIYRE